MGVRIEIVDPGADFPKNVIITGKGTSRVGLTNGELYDRAPIEYPWAQGVPLDTVDALYPNSVDVYVGDPLDPMPQLDLNGVWQFVLDGNGARVTRTSPEGETLVVIEKVEYIRNQYT